ncbi:MAG: adenylyltransferase [Candidatus Levybacteria bacterium CG_4_10_14_0_2_um_filter_36_16]|nr:MAG: hypothetical protein AUK12_01130 [Candidatus Levybacteria bacterium CG2_30_37_29]PIR79585.1 MAG: adenylyltransferase [Candidatus Levybacteria bacterium CG10_big_fil_rev_8_21_14_0_10_36_30]PIZ97275.1 MAG: adenylyltransferase [Candidatus Levybacteria bacterium CG_4_10_14_0_2_um_filter_36_16]PJA90945.1 MAG: adenylyltransferase [Candidatus Levybacteria bacterium CG_4_9_14_3_um_filter_36_7]
MKQLGQAAKKRYIKEYISNLPKIFLTQRQLCDLELILNGGFAPLSGFLNERDYQSVVSKMRLTNGQIWPIPVCLDVEGIEGIKIGQKILLCDISEKPVATLLVESIYKLDKKKEAQYVYGTQSRDHFGVKYLFDKTNDYCLGGTVEKVGKIEHLDYENLRKTPQQLKRYFKKKSVEKIIGFQTRNPIHRAHFWMIKKAAQAENAHVLIHPAVGETKDGDIDYITRVKCYKIINKKYAKDFSTLSLLPLAMRMAGPREAILHAIIRKNYGCTDFIVGRAHADPGTDRRGNLFYEPFDAQKMVQKYAKEIGINIIAFNEMAYNEKSKQYVEVSNKNKDSKSIKRISGTQFRRMLREDEKVPEWFSFPQVIKILKRRVKKQKGFCIFLTGLSSAGKSTIGKSLSLVLMDRYNKPVTLLDGDVIRKHLTKGLGFSKEDRDENIRRIGFVASEIVKHQGVVIVAAIAPYKKMRDDVREVILQAGTFVEVYVSTPLSVCKKRDVKGLYRKAERGIIKHVTGIDDLYEKPKNPEVTLDTTDLSINECVKEVLNYLKKEKVIK